MPGRGNSKAGGRVEMRQNEAGTTIGRTFHTAFALKYLSFMGYFLFGFEASLRSILAVFYNPA